MWDNFFSQKSIPNPYKFYLIKTLIYNVRYNPDAKPRHKPTPNTAIKLNIKQIQILSVTLKLTETWTKL